MTYRLPEPEQKARYVRERFDQIAHVYDRFNDLITQGQHRRWKKTLINRLQIRPDFVGLDMCCGTGDIAQRAQNRLGERGKLFALDFSAAMLQIARTRLNQPRECTTLVTQGDAMRLPFQSNSLDFVTVGYGLRNVENLEACLKEILRVLKPGGQFASLDTGKVWVPILRTLSDFYMFKIVPRIGKWLQPNEEMYDYLPHSTLNFPDQHALKTQMEHQGFVQTEVLQYLFGASVIHLGKKA